MSGLFNAVSGVKDFIGSALTGKGWAIFAFLASTALAAYVAAPVATASTLGFFEGSVAQFLTPLVTPETYTQGFPILGHQLMNTGSAAVGALTSALA